jgi:Kef-type K+ transport system membrane component KefB
MSHSIILVIAIAIIGAMISSGIAKRLNSPQILGYILVGVLLGSECLNIFPFEDVVKLTPLSFIALGIIGFLVGGEIEMTTLKKYGRQFLAILLCEGMLASLFVFIVSFIISYAVLGNMTYALAIGVLLGAISSATDPASTMGVIWEYRAAGILTTTLTAIVALDDVLAMALYAIASNVAQYLCGVGGSGVSSAFIHFAKDIGGALLIGAILGGWLAFYLRKQKQLESPLYAVLGVILFSLGIAQIAHADLILSAMTAGIVATNVAPQQMSVIMKRLREMAFPIYILFFVMVGARLQFSGVPLWIWGIALCYVCARNGGKVLGAYVGAKYSRAPEAVQKNTGLGLFSQGGVTIGLAIVASEHLQEISVTPELSLGSVVITIVTTTTFLIQLIGPAAVKYALKRADEMYRVKTREDILDENSVVSLMDVGTYCVENTPFQKVIELFSQEGVECIAVVDAEKKYLGEIKMSDIQPILASRDIWDWTMAADVMVSSEKTIDSTCLLDDAFTYMHNFSVDQLCVVDGGAYRGMLTNKSIKLLLKKSNLTAA